MKKRKPKIAVIPGERVIARRWNRPQSAFMKAVQSRQYRFIDMEGGIRSGKTTVGIWALITLALEHPGIKMLLARWTGDSCDLQLRPKFYEECPPEILARWDAKENCQYFHNGSMLYIRSLKSSDDKARYAKFTGLTLAVIMLDQPEEIPEDVYSALKHRLSQPGFPQMMILTPNPPGLNHWLVTEFPENQSVPNHLYLHSALRDNVDNIGEATVQELEREYPPTHAMYRRMILGQRGLSIDGEPVYKNSFNRDLHVREIAYMPEFPVYESWDFGQKTPAVTWHQVMPWGHWNILGEYVGTKQFIDQTVPIVANLRNELFPNLLSLRVCCDPAGAQGQGARHTCVEVLNQHLRDAYGPGNAAKYLTNANRPEQRQWCIQQVASYMGRLVRGRPALLVHPRCPNLIDGFEAGYIYDDRAILTGSRLPNFRRPKKDGDYDHTQNTVEYFVLNYLNGPIGAEAAYTANERQRVHLLQQDRDPADYRRAPNRMRSRAGY